MSAKIELSLGPMLKTHERSGKNSGDSDGGKSEDGRSTHVEYVMCSIDYFRGLVCALSNGESGRVG